MRPSQIAYAATKKKSLIPVELTPLFVCCGVAVCLLFYFTGRHFAEDKELRLIRNPNLSILEQVLKDGDDKSSE